MTVLSKEIVCCNFEQSPLEALVSLVPTWKREIVSLLSLDITICVGQLAGWFAA